MLDFITSIWPSGSYNSWVDYAFAITMYILLAFVTLLITGLMACLLHTVYIATFYKSGYGKVIEYKGTVEDMKYTAPRSQYVGVAGKGGHMQHRPEKNEVIIKTSLKTTTIDSDKLYQRVRIGEDVKVLSQKEYIKPRFWQGHWEEYSDRLISVTSIKNQTVEFNEKQPITEGLK